MFVSKLKYSLLLKETKSFLMRSVSGRIPLHRVFSTTKTTEQLDIDKKHGVLAYVPSEVSFDLQPLSGAFL